ncbi:MAG: biliverdin-producing heme oxygenase [Verrucomicrobiales bacterium]|nr:biliverdin-producing heme oxygenase [Verrucomicrobiales bacterium]
MSAFLASMREATSEIHTEVEKSLPLEEYLTSMERYAGLLMRFSYLFLPAERALLRSPLRYHTSVELNNRLRTPSLLDDFAFLESEGLPDFDVNSRQRSWEMLTFPEAVGYLYVLEGSRFGGSQITMAVKELGISRRRGGSFFYGYGAETALMWKKFTEWAEFNLPEENYDEAAAAAVRTFERFQQIMGGSG